MRREQAEAVNKTHAYFHSIWQEDMHAVPRFLWNAKMRFGKTFTTYQLAKKLGAFAYVDSKATKAAEALQKLGGAKVILATAPNAKAIADLVDGLSVGGTLLIVGAPLEPMEISVMQLLLRHKVDVGR